MSEALSIRRKDLDLYKGLAIIAVVLFHVGILPFGYLGVETFFVINGYLVIPKIINQLSADEFRPLTWIRKTLFRLWPVVVVASIVSLLIGYFVMIPDSYENLAESVIASLLFSNNILSAIIERSYWDSVNEFKPLIQMWYLGVLIQSYIILLVSLLSANALFRRWKNRKRNLTLVLTALCCVSFLLYLATDTWYNDKFYLPQYRFWEFAIGGIIGLYARTADLQKGAYRVLPFFLIALLCFILARNPSPLHNALDSVVIVGDKTPLFADRHLISLNITTVCISCLLIIFPFPYPGKILPRIGEYSLSIFVWHQLFLAFLRYTGHEPDSTTSLLLFLFAILAISAGSFYSLERISLAKKSSRIALLAVILSVALSAFMIYLRGGVMRDVPELAISVANPSSNRNTDYIDRVYSWNRPFSSDRIHVLIVGNSFARDFACILEEYDVENRLELSYASDFGSIPESTISRADYLFSFGAKNDIPRASLSALPPHCQLYGIGTKSFGKEFGIFYSRRYSPGYFSQSIPSNTRCDSINRVWANQWGNGRFIDIMEASRLPDGSIRIFTPDSMAISFDCRHLTPAACRFYASRLNLDKIFKSSIPLE